MTMSAITVTEVSKRYGDVVALDSVSLSVPYGSVHALLGPNGSGKSTLLRLIAGLEHPTAGQIDCHGLDIGISFQQPRWFPALTVDENIDIFASMASTAPTPAKIDSICETIRLSPVRHRRAADLSGGFAKKLDLVLSVLKAPDILLLDEPLADVDETSRHHIRSFIDGYRSEDRAVLMATHDREGFAPVVDHATVLLDGQVVDAGEPETVGVGQPD